MKRRRLVLGTIGFLLLGGMGLALQGQTSAKLVLRFQKVNTSREMNASGGGQVHTDDLQSVTVHYPTDSMCLLVYRDGSYYYEKMNERPLGKPKIRAFKGTLTPADLEQLQSITTEPAFHDFSSPAPPKEPDDITFLTEGEVVSATVVGQSDSKQFGGGAQDCAHRRARLVGPSASQIVQ